MQCIKVIPEFSFSPVIYTGKSLVYPQYERGGGGGGGGLMCKHVYVC